MRVSAPLRAADPIAGLEQRLRETLPRLAEALGGAEAHAQGLAITLWVLVRAGAEVRGLAAPQAEPFFGRSLDDPILAPFLQPLLAIPGLGELPAAALGALYQRLLEPETLGGQGVRKKSGSFFTPALAVAHLLERSLDPALDAHLERVRDADAPLFEFFCVDPAMGAGRFLLEALDRIEARFAAFVAERPDLAPTGNLRGEVARRCLNGVDLDPLAVHLARASVWLHAGDPQLTLDALADSLVHGDSLAGVGSVDEADALSPAWREEGAAALDAGVAERLGRAVERVQELAPVQFPVRFPAAYRREGPGFDCVVGNPPWEEATLEALSFWSQRFPGLKRLGNAAQHAEVERLRSAHPALVQDYARGLEQALLRRQVLERGPFAGNATGDPDLYKAFLWRFWQLVRPGGYVGVVLPLGAFVAKGSALWREHALLSSRSDLVLCRNDGRWLFDNNPAYWSTLFAAQVRGPEPASLTIRGTCTCAEDLATLAERPAVSLSPERLRASDPLLCVPKLDSPRALALWGRLLGHPPLGAKDRPDFRALPTADLHVTNDGRKRELFTDDPRDYPIYNHRNVGLFSFDLSPGAFNHCSYERVTHFLEARRARAARNRRSPYAEMPPDWVASPSTLPCRTPRLAFRDVVHSTNPRKVWAAVLPANTLVTNKAPHLLFPRGDLAAQAVLLGLLCSSVCDWFGHLRVNLNLNYFILNALPIPVARPSDPRAVRLASLAAGLACEASGELGAWRELAAPIESREDALAEADALASRLYDLPDDVLDLVWDRPSRPPLDAVRRWRAVWA